MPQHWEPNPSCCTGGRTGKDKVTPKPEMIRTSVGILDEDCHLYCVAYVRVFPARLAREKIGAFQALTVRKGGPQIYLHCLCTHTHTHTEQ